MLFLRRIYTEICSGFASSRQRLLFLDPLDNLWHCVHTQSKLGKKGEIPSQVRYRIAGLPECISFAGTKGYGLGERPNDNPSNKGV